MGDQGFVEVQFFVYGLCGDGGDVFVDVCYIGQFVDVFLLDYGVVYIGQQDGFVVFGGGLDDKVDVLYLQILLDLLEIGGFGFDWEFGGDVGGQCDDMFVLLCLVQILNQLVVQIGVGWGGKQGYGEYGQIFVWKIWCSIS